LSEGTVAEMVASLQRPDGSDFESLGPDEGTRIYYQFIDERNRVRFVERLEDVPERWRVNAGFVEMSSPPPLTPADARATVARRMESTRKQRDAGTPRVLLYYADWCGYCRKAKAHLDSLSWISADGFSRVTEERASTRCWIQQGFDPGSDRRRATRAPGTTSSENAV
jgi:thiol-disulfide isomerase/thioredoxin